MIEYKATINGIDVEARYSEHAVNSIFLPFLVKLTELKKEKGKRLLVMLAAPPGAGKSTLLSYLEKLSREHEELCDIQAVGMDGFHRRQEYLQTQKAALEQVLRLCKDNRMAIVNLRIHTSNDRADAAFTATVALRGFMKSADLLDRIRRIPGSPASWPP